MEQQKHHNSKKQNCERASIKTESREQYHSPDVHGVANELVGACCDKFKRRIEDGRRSSPSRDKDSCTRKHDQRADGPEENSNNSDPGRYWNVQAFVPRLNTRCEPSEKQDERGHVAQRPEGN